MLFHRKDAKIAKKEENPENMGMVFDPILAFLAARTTGPHDLAVKIPNWKAGSAEITGPLGSPEGGMKPTGGRISEFSCRESVDKVNNNTDAEMPAGKRSAVLGGPMGKMGSSPVHVSWRMALAGLALIVFIATPARSQILNCNNDQVIPGTQGITLGPGVNLSGWNTPGHELEYAALGDDGYGVFPAYDLTTATFANSDLTGAVFGGSTLTNANFTSANLTGTDFESSILTNANFTDATADCTSVYT